MGKRGPAPTPTKLKVTRGTYRKDRTVENEVDFSGVEEIPKPPTYFDAVAKRTWNKTIRNLDSQGILSEVDLELLTGYCQQFSVMERAARDVKKKGLTIEFTNKAGATNTIKNPAIGIYNDALNSVKAIAQQFGFSPSSRTSIATPNKDDEDPMSGLMNFG